MRVVVDTSVWSLVLRRRAPQDGPMERELRELVGEGRVVMLGQIRQELLSGVRGDNQFRALRDRLRAFDDLVLDNVDYEEAASCSNKCRSRGLQGGSVDFLICAVSMRREIPIFSTDKDFAGFTTVLAIKRHEIRDEFAP